MNAIAPTAVVSSVNHDGEHRFSKQPHEQVTLLAGIGIEGDAHSGTTVQHMSRVGDPERPNLRQVHLIHSELFAEVADKGFTVTPGDMGENITTTGIDLLALPQGTILRLGDEAAVQVTGLRNPCSQINAFQPGLMKAVIGRDENGDIVRKAGVMSVVLAGGIVQPGDSITIELPAEPHLPLAPV